MVSAKTTSFFPVSGSTVSRTRAVFESAVGPGKPQHRPFIRLIQGGCALQRAAIRSDGGHRVDRELTGVEHNVCDRLAHLQDYGLRAGKRAGREIGGEPELIALRANRFG